MLKKILVILIVGSFAIGTLSCGSSPNSEACAAVVAKIFDSCVLTNEDDVQTILNALNQLGETEYTQANIQSSTPDQIESECTDLLDESGTKYTDEEVQAIEETLNELPDNCEIASAWLAALD